LVRGNVHGLRDGFGVAFGSLGGAGQFRHLQHDQTCFEARACADSWKNPSTGACSTASSGVPESELEALAAGRIGGSRFAEIAARVWLILPEIAGQSVTIGQ
jgi:hypothetical protein